MKHYTYTAINRGTGRKQRGVIQGSSRGEVTGLLRSRGLALTDLAQVAAGPEVPRPKRRSWPGLGRSPRRKDLMAFTRQLATLVNAGLPLTRGLEVLQRQERNPGFRGIMAELVEVIGAGGTLSDGLLRHRRLFDPLYINMVKAGEAGGALGAVLERLAHSLEKTERLKGRVQTAMIYPVVIMAVAGGILTGLMLFVVPKFEQIFSGLLKGQPLPALTRGLLMASTFIRTHCWLTLGAGVVVWVMARSLQKTVPGRRAWDRALLRAPVLGELLLKAMVARFARTLGALLTSGVPILDALTIARATSGNIHVSAALGQVHDRIKQGDSIARPLAATAIFPGLVTGLIQVGEETGALPAMLGRIADTYDEEVDNAVAGLTSVIEPVMIVLMALVVGVIVIALFLPIVSVIQHLQ